MSQSGFTPIQLYHSTTSGTAPVAGNLVNGELAINIADGKLFYKDNGGVVRNFGTGINYTRITTATTLVDKQGVIADTTGGAFTINLPATPTAGVQVWVADGGAWGTNNLTIARNGSTIEGLAENLVCDISGAEIQMIYDGTTWQVYAQTGVYGAASTGTGSPVLNTAPTLINPTITNYTETVFSANSGTAITLDLANGTFQNITLTGNATITMPTAVAGKSFLLLLSQDATGSRTVTWSTVVWPSGTPPTITGTASKRDIYSFYSNGTSWFGVTVGQNY